MATVFTASSREEMRYLRAGSIDVDRHRATLERARAQLSSLSGSARSALSTLIEKVSEVDIAAVRRGVQALRRASKSAFASDTLRPYVDIGEIQHLKSRCLRYNMANPRILKARRSGALFGYGDRFIDIEPYTDPYERADYRAVTTGMYNEEEDAYITYTDVDSDSYDDALTTNERYDTLIMWESTEYHFDQCDSDPTSPSNHKL